MQWMLQSQPNPFIRLVYQNSYCFINVAPARWITRIKPPSWHCFLQVFPPFWIPYAVSFNNTGLDGIILNTAPLLCNLRALRGWEYKIPLIFLPWRRHSCDLWGRKPPWPRRVLQPLQANQQPLLQEPTDCVRVMCVDVHCTGGGGVTTYIFVIASEEILKEYYCCCPHLRSLYSASNALNEVLDFGHSCSFSDAKGMIQMFYAVVYEEGQLSWSWIAICNVAVF